MEPPTRCTAEEISVVLAAAAQPQSAVILDQPIDPVSGPLEFTTSALWRVRLWRDATQGLHHTQEAVSPDGRTWQWGCQRNWTTDGNIIEPLDMLTPEQRHQLDVRLQSAVAWPEPELIASAVLPLQERVKAKAKPMRRAR
jgi:hypothetical protein